MNQIDIDYATIAKSLEEMVVLLVKKERLPHVYGVVEFIEKMARRYRLDAEKLRVMALAHDMFRDVNEFRLKRLAQAYGIEINDLLEKKPILLHGLIAAEYLKKRFNLIEEFNKDLLNGIRYHTSGHRDFGLYSKVLVISDCLEFTRSFDKVNQLRELAFYDLNIAFKEVIRNKILYAINFNLYVLPHTLDTWNKLIEEERK